MGLSTAAFAQKKGYDIKVQFETGTSLDGTTCYLTGFYGDEVNILDSVRIKKGIARFKKSALLPDGYYEIGIKGYSKTTLSCIVVEKNRKFLISNDTIINSIENQIYRNFLLYKSTISNSSDEMNTYVNALRSTSPNSLVSKYIGLENFGLDSCDSSETRYLRHPEFNQLISTKLMSGDIAAIDQTLNRFGGASEISQYYLGKMMKYYNMDNNAPYDEVLVHLYDNYYVPNNLHLFSETYERTLRKAVERKRRVLIGTEIPALEAPNAEGKRESTKDLQRKFTVIWFWDSDCEDCQVETPELHKFYVENSETYDFDVFAYCLNDDVERWKKFTQEWGLTWTNTCSGTGDSNYDFIDYFNLVTTPGCVLIDENNKIIMRQFTLEQLENFFQNNYQNRE